jgi:hypothetical protein
MGLFLATDDQKDDVMRRTIHLAPIGLLAAGIFIGGPATAQVTKIRDLMIETRGIIKAFAGKTK